MTVHLFTCRNALRNFFEREVESYRENVRNGNLDPADGFHPTLASAVDSLQQAPEDYRREWLGIPDDHHLAHAEVGVFDVDDAVDRAIDILLTLTGLIIFHGADTALVDFTEGAIDW